MQINVTVTDLDLSSVIGEQRDYDVEGDYVGSSNYTIADRVADQIAKDLQRDEAYSTLKKRVMDIRDAEIRAQVKPRVEAAIEAPVQRTNSYGSPVGEPTTLNELIIDEVREFLTKRRNDYRDNRTEVQHFISEAVERVVKKELAEAIVEEKVKVVAAVRAKAAELIAEAVKKGIG